MYNLDCNMFLMEITFDTSLLIITYNLLCIKQQFECWLKFNHIFSKHLISQTNHQQEMNLLISLAKYARVVMTMVSQYLKMVTQSLWITAPLTMGALV